MSKRPPLPETLPLWKGRRGTINTAVCVVLGLACAFGLFFIADRAVIVPACSGYANSHGMTYSDFTLSGVKRASNVVCRMTKPGGKVQEMHLSELVPIYTDYAASFTMSLEFTVPGFILPFAILRTGVWQLGRRDEA